MRPLIFQGNSWYISGNTWVCVSQIPLGSNQNRTCNPDLKNENIKRRNKHAIVPNNDCIQASL
jgi:hypothetical protein